MTLKLIADIGATNVRVAFVDEAGEIRDLSHFPASDYRGPVEVIREACAKFGRPIPRRGCLGVAAPVKGDFVDFTNSRWSFSVSEVKKMLGMEELLVLNDTVAWAFSLATFPIPQTLQVGGFSGLQEGTRGFLVPGSGLGVAGLLPFNEAWLPIAGEGGYIEVVGGTDYEREVLGVVRALHGRVSAERVLSGPGLVELFSAISVIEGSSGLVRSSEQIVAGAIRNNCVISSRTADVYLALLGEIAGSIALLYGATGGVFLSGNITNALNSLVLNSRFRENFDAKGRGGEFLRDIPCYWILGKVDALTGCSRAIEMSGDIAGLFRA